NGSVSSTGYGLGGSLTWYGAGGFYLDAQANLTWYDSALASSTAATGLVSGNGGFGYAIGVEAGQQVALNQNWSITPQAQLTYSDVSYDGFTDAFGAAVSLAEGDDLTIRLGLSADYQDAWIDETGDTSRLHAYGIANLYYDVLPDSRTDLAGVELVNTQDNLWGGLGIGGTYAWGDDKYAIHGQAGVNTSLVNFGSSYSLAGTAGLTVKF
ncbi:autotransporter outer membrane beta-barrel domain-containing protein, partial [Devosia sp. ZW T5_3]|uniref:autotransporter outer membrane beta-barrel domain-containing protein n=1 Tax=Devosia sp. ZW T5_3 TaxID=3378085 RepID=UPI003852032C